MRIIYVDALNEKPFETRGARYRIIGEKKEQQNGEEVLKILCNVKREFVEKAKRENKEKQQTLF